MVAQRATLSERRHEVQQLITGDMPTVIAVCGFRFADRISPDA